jgi:GNAT superfamily N-acetyltransferase
MPADSKVGLRLADASDAPGVARLHADSWRRHYRGAYSAAYLDGDLDVDRLTVWSTRLEQSSDDHFTVVAEADATLVGFAHATRDAGSTWGAFVENVHVAHPWQGRGVGTALLSKTAHTVLERWPGRGLYLWVLEQNSRAQAFYRARSGILGDREFAAAPGGDARNLDGAPRKIRVTWADPAALLTAGSATSAR